MIGLIRLICESKCQGQGKRQRAQLDGPERKVFDVPKAEAPNLKRRLEAAGWIVTAVPL